MTFKIIWLTPDRFDTKKDKSSWTEMAAALTNKGHNVTILTSQSKNKTNDKDLDTNLIYVKALDIPLIFRYSALLNMLLWLKKHASSSDIIILNQDSLILAPILRKFGLKKIHLDIRTIPVDIHSVKDRLDKFLFWYLPLKLFGKTLTSYSFITERLREEVEKEFEFSVKNHVIWQSGVNTDSFYPIYSSYRSTKKIRLFYHGTISVNRGIGLVIAAIPLLSNKIDMEFVIIGDGSGMKELVALTNNLSLNDRVAFRGLMPYEKMAEEISKADICICPLTNRLEWNVSSPIKIFEYMACGKPMILTPISAHKDVADNLPFVVWTEGFTPDDFKNAITDAINNHEKLSSYRNLATGLVKKNYQWENQAVKLEKYLCKTMQT